MEPPEDGAFLGGPEGAEQVFCVESRIVQPFQGWSNGVLFHGFHPWLLRLDPSGVLNGILVRGNLDVIARTGRAIEAQRVVYWRMNGRCAHGTQ